MRIDQCHLNKSFEGPWRCLCFAMHPPIPHSAFFDITSHQGMCVVAAAKTFKTESMLAKHGLESTSAGYVSDTPATMKSLWQMKELSCQSCQRVLSILSKSSCQPLSSQNYRPVACTCGRPTRLGSSRHVADLHHNTCDHFQAATGEASRTYQRLPNVRRDQ